MCSSWLAASGPLRASQCTRREPIVHDVFCRFLPARRCLFPLFCGQFTVTDRSIWQRYQHASPGQRRSRRKGMAGWWGGRFFLVFTTDREVFGERSSSEAQGMALNIFRFSLHFPLLLFFLSSVKSEDKGESRGCETLRGASIPPSLVLQCISPSLCSSCLLHLHKLTDCFSSWPME